jgi:hypothetical protein
MEKYIGRKDLEAIVATQLNTGKVLYRLHRYFCKPMELRGKCRNECNVCKDYILHVFDVTAQAKGRDPYGNLVWAIRETLAEIDEREELPRARRPTDWLDQPVDRSPFKALKRELP